MPDDDDLELALKAHYRDRLDPDRVAALASKSSQARPRWPMLALALLAAALVLWFSLPPPPLTRESTRTAASVEPELASVQIKLYEVDAAARARLEAAGFDLHPPGQAFALDPARFPNDLNPTLAPRLEVPLGHQGEFYVGGGEPDDGFTVYVVPKRDDQGWVLSASLDLPGPEGSERFLSYRATGPDPVIGFVVRQDEQTWLLVIALQAGQAR